MGTRGRLYIRKRLSEEGRIFCVCGTKLSYIPNSSLADKQRFPYIRQLRACTQQRFERHYVLSGVVGVREPAPCARLAGGCRGAGRDIGLPGDGLVVPNAGRKGNRERGERREA